MSLNDTLHEVLERHIRSSESMERTYERVGTQEEIALQQGITIGLKRALEVVDNRVSAALAVATPEEGEKETKR